MSRDKLSLIGQRFGRWVVTEFVRINKHCQSMWGCVCDCGSFRVVPGNSLKSGSTKSCGCFQREQVSKTMTKHGQGKLGLTSNAYRSWQHMIQRCYNPNNRAYPNYGGIGRKVCDRWLESFDNFYEDMGDCPDGMSLDRKDNDGDYCKENCRWATREEQQNNMRSNKWYEYNGESKTIAQWARSLDMSPKLLCDRLHKPGWSTERALSEPVRYRRPRCPSL